MAEHIYDMVARDPEIRSGILVILVLLFLISLFEGGYLDFLIGVPTTGAFSGMLGLDQPQEFVPDYCGDGYCDPEEDGSTCMADCGNVAPICKQYPDMCRD